MKELNELVSHAQIADAENMKMYGVEPDDVFAIWKAFRALEQRAEAAEAKLETAVRAVDNLDAERNTLRAKLAELEKQEPAFLLSVDSRDSEQYQFDIRAKLSDGIHELFTRPAPAVSLAEMVPDGWKMVPVEPTESMIVDGFESEPDAGFSEPDEWKTYQMMSGCQQAAYKARLCWAAMLAAAPEPE